MINRVEIAIGTQATQYEFNIEVSVNIRFGFVVPDRVFAIYDDLAGRSLNAPGGMGIPESHAIS